MSNSDQLVPEPTARDEARSNLRLSLDQTCASYGALLEAFSTGQGIDDARSSFDLSVRGLGDALRDWETAEGR